MNQILETCCSCPQIPSETRSDSILTKVFGVMSFRWGQQEKVPGEKLISCAAGKLAVTLFFRPSSRSVFVFASCFVFCGPLGWGEVTCSSHFSMPPRLQCQSLNPPTAAHNSTWSRDMTLMGHVTAQHLRWQNFLILREKEKQIKSWSDSDWCASVSLSEAKKGHCQGKALWLQRTDLLSWSCVCCQDRKGRVSPEASCCDLATARAQSW